VHHKDGNPSNNEISNLEIKDVVQHAIDHQPRIFLDLICEWCGCEFERTPSVERGNRKHKFGPFCGKSCAGSWSRDQQIQNGLVNLRA
jgi:hypothetical protein